MADMVAGDLSRVSSAVVMEAAGRGDALAAGIVNRFVEDLGLGLSNLMHIFDPQLIVLGGGVSQSFDDYADALLAATRRYTMANLRDKVNVTTTALGDDAPLLGAAQDGVSACGAGRIGVLGEGALAGVQTVQHLLSRLGCHVVCGLGTA